MGRLLRGAALLCFCELLPGSGSLPDLHGAILPASRNISAVWRPTHRVDSLWLPPEGSNRLPAGTIPDLDSVDILADSHAPGGNALAIRRPGHTQGFIGAGEPLIGKQWLGIGGIQNMDHAKAITHDNTRAIGRPGQASGAAALSGETGNDSACAGIPNIYAKAIPRRKTSTIRRPGHWTASLKGEQDLAVGGVPDLQRAIVTSGEDACAIGRPGQVPDDASIHLRWIVGIGQQHIAGGGIPDKYLALGWSILASAGRDNARAIGRPGQGVDGLRVLAEGEDWLAGQRVPDLHGGIVSRRGNPFAIGRPGQRSDWA